MDFKKLTVYQIYPKSFKDTTGNGLGDIQGIIQKLDYLQTLGINCLWITPIYPSPQKDNGYDVADYIGINPDYGTMADFDELIAQCRSRDIEIMLDMVFNHSSDQHPWFQKALAGEQKYKDYYIFRASEEDQPPTNWVSKFGGNAWERYKGDEYYLHLFDVTQPDLNWENPELRQEIYAIMNFWLEKGIRGFRFDVINLISKGAYENDDQGDGRRLYTDGPKIHEYLKELNAQTFGKYDKTITVGEMSSTSIDHCINYSNPEENELDMTFSFHHLKVDYQNGDKWSDVAFDFLALKKLLIDWQVGMEQGGGHNALFWCNHDQPRVISRFGDESEASGKMLATAIHLMKGTPYIYQGEEIGMTNAKFSSIEQYRDVESVNYYNILKGEGKSEGEILNILGKKSRDNSRTPMQWNGGDYAGFSETEPWLGVIHNYPQINVEAVMAQPDSIFYHYQKLVKLRKELDVISHGTFEPLMAEHPQVFAYVRGYEGQRLLVVNNFYGEDVRIEVPAEFLAGQVLIANQGDVVLEERMVLRGYESFAVLA